MVNTNHWFGLISLLRCAVEQRFWVDVMRSRIGIARRRHGAPSKVNELQRADQKSTAAKTKFSAGSWRLHLAQLKTCDGINHVVTSVLQFTSRHARQKPLAGEAQFAR